jgi:hypothetical protein
VGVEERPLHRASRDAAPLRLGAERGEVAFPVGHGKAPSATVTNGGVERVQELPHANVEHAVAPRVEQCEDRRGDGDGHARQARERRHSLAFAPRRQRRARDNAHQGWRVLQVMPASAGALPGGHQDQLRPAEGAAAPHSSQTGDERCRDRILLEDRQVDEPSCQRAAAQTAQRHGGTGERPAPPLSGSPAARNFEILARAMVPG